MYMSNEFREQGKCGKILLAGIVNTDRRRDLLPYYEADTFLRFIEEEVLTLMSERYCIRSRILFGHSFGGATVMHCLLKKPELFDFYLASSPKPIQNMLDAGKYEALDKDIKGEKYLFVSYGEKDHRTVRRDLKKLVSILENNEYDRLKTKLECLPGLRHNNAAPSALLKGLEDWQFMQPRGN